MKAGTPYECSVCGGTFVREIDDEEAIAEAIAEFGIAEETWRDGQALVCPGCYDGVKRYVDAIRAANGLE